MSNASLFDDPFGIFAVATASDASSSNDDDSLKDLLFADDSSSDSSADANFDITKKEHVDNAGLTNDIPVVDISEPLEPLKFSKGINWDSALGDETLTALNPDRGHKLMTRWVSDLSTDELEVLLRSGPSSLQLQNGARREIVFPLADYMRYLTYLCFGRDSAMFHFNRRKMVFETHYNLSNINIRVTGFTEHSLRKLEQFAVELGSRIRRLKHTVKEITKKLDDQSSLSSSNNNYNDDTEAQGIAIIIAFTECVARIVRNLERYVNITEGNSRGDSPINVINSFKSSHKLVSVLTTILGCHDLSVTAKLSELPSPFRLLDEIYTRAVIFYQSDPDLFEVVKLLLVRCSEPWFQSVSRLMGLQNTYASSQNTPKNNFAILWQPLQVIAQQMPFIRYDQDTQQISLDREQAPLFLDDSSALKIIQTLNCLLVFVHHSKDDSLTLYLNSFEDTPQLQWFFTETELDKFEQDLTRYSDLLETFLAEYESGQHMQLQVQAKPTDTDMDTDVSMQDVQDVHDQPVDSDHSNTDDDFFQQPLAFQQLINQTNQKNPTHDQPVSLQIDPLDMACKEVLDGDGSANHLTLQHIPIEMLPRLGFCKLIHKQWQISNRLVLSTFFNDCHEFKMYKELTRGLLLMGFGPFLTELLDTTFMDDYTNPRTGAVGLNLENRRQWPPKELEINYGLSDAVEEAVKAMGYPSHVSVNFGLALTEEQQQQQDVNDIRCTDILHLQFNIPMPYSLVMTKRILKISNRIFAKLLQLYRIQQLMIRRRCQKKGHHRSENWPQEHYVHTSHLIYCLLNHVQSAIAVHWATLEKTDYQSLPQLINIYDTTMEKMYRAIFISNKVQDIQTGILDECLKRLRSTEVFDDSVSRDRTAELCQSLESHSSASASTSTSTSMLLLSLKTSS